MPPELLFSSVWESNGWKLHIHTTTRIEPIWLFTWVPLMWPHAAGLCWLEPVWVCWIGQHNTSVSPGGIRHKEHPTGQLYSEGGAAVSHCLTIVPYRSVLYVYNVVYYNCYKCIAFEGNVDKPASYSCHSTARQESVEFHCAGISCLDRKREFPFQSVIFILPGERQIAKALQ